MPNPLSDKDLVKILEELEQDPKHYYALRIQLVEVKKYPIIGFSDNNITGTTFIPNEPIEAFRVFEKIRSYIHRFTAKGDYTVITDEGSKK